MELGQASRELSESSEAEADDYLGTADHSVEKIYGEIRAILRVSVINLPFSYWSNQPRMLQFVWNSLKPNLASRYLESAADRIRERAVRMITARFPLGELRAAAGGDSTSVTIQRSRAVVDIHHYGNPKLFIATAGLLEALQGHSFQPVKDQLLRMPVPQGIPPAMPRLRVGDQPAAAQRDDPLLSDIKETFGLPMLSSDYLCLSALSGYLGTIWPELKSIIRTEAFWQFAEDLEALAALLARGLPHPTPFAASDFRRLGLTLLEVRNCVIPSHMSLARLILSMAALKVALDGKETALESPYPISADVA